MKITYDNLPKNDGEVRQLILEAIVGIRDGSLDNSQAANMVAAFKELNTSINASISTAKLGLQMEDRGRKFVQTLRMGRQEIGGNEEGEKSE